MVKLFGKNTVCVNCEIAKNELNRLNIPFEFIDVTEDKEGLKEIKEQGFRQVPVFYFEGDYFKDINDLLEVYNN